MRIPGSRMVRTAARFLRSRLRGRLLVLGYHRVDGEPDPYGMTVHPDRFAAQLDVLARSARVLPLTDAVARLSAGTLPPRAVALTFDDGYSDLKERIESMLAERDMRATAFIATGFLGGEFWWDRLTRILGSTSADQLYSIQSQLEFLPVEVREARLEALERAAARSEPPRVRPLTAGEVSSLAKGRVIEIGSHTVAHGRLTSLAPRARRREVRASKKHLEEIVDGPVTAFSYPHGAVDRTARDEVRNGGYSVGCGSMPEAAWRGSDRADLPRLWPGNWPADRFEAWLRRWLPRKAA